MTDVACPGCRTTLRIPASIATPRVKCPKCGMLLAIRPAGGPGAPSLPSSPGRPRWSPPPSRPANPFSDVPPFQAASAPPRRTPLQRPAPPRTQPSKGRTQPQPRTPQQWTSQRGRKPKKSAAKTLLTVLGVFAAVGVSMLLICGGLFAYFVYRGMQHSGWQEVTFHGYTIKMPSEKMNERTVPRPGVTVHEAVYRRRESGSQYLLLVSQSSVEELRNLDVSQLVRRSSVTLAGQKQVQRDGITGIRGTVIAGPFGAKGSEAEFFMHNGNMIIAIYAPYSAIRDAVGGGRRSRDNEAELDRPEEFFESLKFP